MSKGLRAIIESSSAELEDNKKIIQVTYFDEITEEDIRKTKWLLGKYVDMVDIIKTMSTLLKKWRMAYLPMICFL